MTQPQDQYRELVQQSQQAFQNAVETWTKTVQDTMSSAGVPNTPAQVDPQQVVDQVFEFAERMLAMQRDFTRNLIQSSVALQQSVTGQGGQDSTPSSDI
jgi:uncharacterized ferritin-like protein (DUF455 family)